MKKKMKFKNKKKMKIKKMKLMKVLYLKQEILELIQKLNIMKIKMKVVKNIMIQIIGKVL